MKKRKNEIIQACIQLISQKGADLSSMQNIANEVGITKSTLYFYYDSKESLIREVYLYCHSLDAQACNEGIDQIDHSIEKLFKRFDNIINYAISHPQEAKVEAIITVSPIYQKDAEMMKYSFMQDIIAIIHEGIIKDEIKAMPEWILAEAYYGFATSMYWKFIKNPQLWNDMEIRNYCYEIIKNIFINNVF